CLQYDECPYTF
nr:immunoglobulin light chain junction region [Mus musculus]